ncbi:low-density lipoprotein receptor-related protein 12-like [Patiria miniata]|uniref:CUB domain-containing protein n=1 Tax=Patiria miniata TaxID=46514 RepID=A0A914AV91_PATMI|nr:low-density lipoprotein receptor-related protein 12-like [Patiria miniata]
MANLRRQRIIAVGFLMVFIGAANAAEIAKVFMDEKCGETIQAGRSGGQMDSQLSMYYANDFDCTVTITADIGRQILLTFDRVDIEGTPSGDSGCDGDYLEVYEGTSTILSPVQVICGMYASDIVSSLNSVTLRFKTDSSSIEEGFLLSYTSFKSPGLTSCDSDEFECDNDRCIDATLKNNFNDNCGDNSDEDPFGGLDDALNNAISLGIGIIVAIIIGCIVGVVLLCVCVGCICYHCCCKRSQPQQTSYQVVAQTPQQRQQPPMAMQPIGQPGQQAPYDQPGAYPPGQPAYPPGPPAYPAGQPVYPPGQPGGYPAGEKV